MFLYDQSISTNLPPFTTLIIFPHPIHPIGASSASLITNAAHVRTSRKQQRYNGAYKSDAQQRTAQRNDTRWCNATLRTIMLICLLQDIWIYILYYPYIALSRLHVWKWDSLQEVTEWKEGFVMSKRRIFNC